MITRKWQRWWAMIGVVFGLGWGLLSQPTRTEAATKPVLLVVDSQNAATTAPAQLDALQRLLTSMALPVETVRLTAYRAHQLTPRRYSGVITMINWPQSRLGNATFERDRQKFNGPDLHIGANLTAWEAKRLGAKRVALHHQQFNLREGEQQQLLPYQVAMTGLPRLATTSQIQGWLITQTAQERHYPFGLVNHQRGYLPYFEPQGLALVMAAKTIKTLFHSGQSQPPLLTITGVTPYSNMNALLRVIRLLYHEGIPFAISTTSVDVNTKLPAFERFSAVLRAAEKRNGIIFLRTPIETGIQRLRGRTLQRVLRTEVTALSQHNVFPVGLSSPGRWNQTLRTQTAGLSLASTNLLLPTPTTAKLTNHNQRAQTYTHSFFGVPLNQLSTVTHAEAIQFQMPTALTVSLPQRATDRQALRRQLHRLQLTWFNPALGALTTRIKTGAADVQYQAGTYQLNGRVVADLDVGPGWWRQRQPKRQVRWIDRYFQVQSHVLLALFTVIGVVLIVFGAFGYRVYRRMFIKSD